MINGHRSELVISLNFLKSLQNGPKVYRSPFDKPKVYFLHSTQNGPNKNVIEDKRIYIYIYMKEFDSKIRGELKH